MQFATTSSAEEVMELVQEQHRDLKQLLEAVTKTAGAERSATFSTLRRYLAVHEAVEESFIHPVGEQELADPDVARERVDEEDDAGEVMTTLEGLDPGSADFEQTLGELAEAVTSHAEAEETEELPALLAAADDAALGQMAQGLEYVAELVMQPGSPLGRGDTSPFLVILDSAKEELGQLAEHRNDSPG
ncbi:hemerythrin domain-containing protein [Segeticoccus rhizosphaerae]|jgi:uncharacterized lipoprotein NlpE involved in copper resistance|uniref:hemerythrin domain-containing protein n=1 Tax=Segeticoccus rhizosphaerae TaxID=1104777 RepID=UPI0010C0E59E|nr:MULTISPECIES: hemerythrin domain-containing protein [Intrasporangiaceae]